LLKNAILIKASNFQEWLLSESVYLIIDQSLAPHFLASIQIWVPSNPRGAERLPPGIVEAESDFYLRRLWGKPSEVCILTLSLLKE